MTNLWRCPWCSHMNSLEDLVDGAVSDECANCHCVRPEADRVGPDNSCTHERMTPVDANGTVKCLDCDEIGEVETLQQHAANLRYRRLMREEAAEAADVGRQVDEELGLEPGTTVTALDDLSKKG